MSDVIETKRFACMAEAVAEYFGRGFTTSEDASFTRKGAYCPARLMHDDEGHEVFIRHIGFMDVKATMINL